MPYLWQSLRFKIAQVVDRDARGEGAVRSNLKSPHGVGRAPSDTALLEHNHGHGVEHLATVFAFLMMPAFPVDQARQRRRAKGAAPPADGPDTPVGSDPVQTAYHSRWRELLRELSQAAWI